MAILEARRKGMPSESLQLVGKLIQPFTLLSIVVNLASRVSEHNHFEINTFSTIAQISRGAPAWDSNMGFLPPSKGYASPRVFRLNVPRGRA